MQTKMTSSMMHQADQNHVDVKGEHPANHLHRNSPDHSESYRSNVRLQPVIVNSTSPPGHTLANRVIRTSHVHHLVTLPSVTSLQKTSVSPSKHLPPVVKSMSPTHDVSHEFLKRTREGRGFHEQRGSCDESEGRGLHEGRGLQEGRFLQEQQVKAARRRELARRHLSNSLQGARTVLPVLRRTQSFSVPVYQNSVSRTHPHQPKRETVSLGPRKPAHDMENSIHLTRRHSLREDHANINKESPHPLSLSLPHPSPGNVSLAALVHELNATMHYPSSPSRRHSGGFSDNDDTVFNFDDENGLDPDLCLRLTGKDTCSMVNRALTPALRKLNRRKVSSRVRTQQWVNQIEAEERCKERTRKLTESDSFKNKPPQVALIFEQEI
ncbi:hypothetical protein V1264_013775 [Littorina saxatilis]|uniref:Uncharacterized protein n=1 Tax=Littorina saxatilis TaxID=31220 RepID=A0AAN9BRC7_9CAEN